MNRSVAALLGASWLAVARVPLLVPCLAAGLLVVVTYPSQDSGHAVSVMHGVGVLLACACTAMTDDPSGEVAASSPYPVRVRTGARILAGLCVVLPVFVVAAAVARLRFTPTPLTLLTTEALAYVLTGLALGAGLRRWTDRHAPAYPAAVGLLGLALLTGMLPRGWRMVDAQPWGPPFEAALIRWGALILMGVGVLMLALRDRAEPPT
jgi:hypothetical protein